MARHIPLEHSVMTTRFGDIIGVYPAAWVSRGVQGRALTEPNDRAARNGTSRFGVPPVSQCAGPTRLAIVHLTVSLAIERRPCDREVGDYFVAKAQVRRSADRSQPGRVDRATSTAADMRNKAWANCAAIAVGLGRQGAPERRRMARSVLDVLRASPTMLSGRVPSVRATPSGGSVRPQRRDRAGRRSRVTG